MSYRVRVTHRAGWFEYTDHEAKTVKEAQGFAQTMEDGPISIMVRTLENNEINWKSVPAKVTHEAA